MSKLKVSAIHDPDNDNEALTIDTSGNVGVSQDLSFGDNVKAQFGASNDLKIFHDGGNSYVQENGTGSLYLDTYNGTEVALTCNNNTEYMVKAVRDGAVSLWHNNSEKLSTTSTGVNVTGALTVNGSAVGGSNTPYFLVKSANDISASNGTATELSFSGGTELEDSDSLMGTTRFTPDVAGYYYIWGSVRLRAWDANQLDYAWFNIRRNGSDTFASGSCNPSSNENEVQIACSGIDYFNGTTDYASIYWAVGTQNGSSARLSEAFFGGYKLIT